MDFLEKAGLRTKILVPVTAVMVLLLAATVLIVNQRLQQQVEENSRQQLDAAKLRFQLEQTNHLNQLKFRFQSLAREPIYVAAFRVRDDNGRPNQKTIQTQLATMVEKEGLTNEGVAFIYFAPADFSPPVIQMLTNSLSDADVAAGCAASVKSALADAPLPDTVRIGTNLFNVISIPIFNVFGDQIIGALAFGEELGLSVAQDLCTGTGGSSCAAFFAGTNVITSTLPGANDPAGLVARFRGLDARAGINAPLERAVIDGKHYFCSSGNFSSLNHDATLGYLLFTSYEDELTALSATRSLLAAFSMAAILIGSVAVWFLVYRAMRPLSELRNSAEAVGRGDFSRRVNIRTRDECGELATVFNRMTENIEQSQAQLQQTVQTLKNTQQQLIQSEKLSAVGEFVAGVAHELNNPLAAVMGFSEILRDTGADDKHHRHLDLIHKSAQRCQKIVQSLLSFARRHQPERKPVAVNQLVEDVIEIVGYQLRTSNVEIKLELAPRLPVLLADGHQLQQVLINLINNARQAIEAHQPSGQISVKTETNGKVVRIVIHDNGPGIPPENLKRIFDPFFTTKEVGKGTGLGLSLCYGLIQEHGGSITPASQPGQGATFTIELPVTNDAGGVAENAVPAPAASPDNLREGAGKKILLIDDEEMLLEMIREDLRRHGYEVTAAGSGEAALREIHAQKFDAICCDLKMPGLNGRQVFDWICVARPDLSRRVIFMTGDIINEPLQKFLDQEKIHCLNKPFALGEMRQTIKTMLAKL
jgi:two-component system, NtrC family, sensor kinase